MMVGGRLEALKERVWPVVVEPPYGSVRGDQLEEFEDGGECIYVCVYIMVSVFSCGEHDVEGNVCFLYIYIYIFSWYRNNKTS